MGKLLPNFRKSIIDEIVTNITSNTSQYYVFTAGPVPAASVANVTMDDYSTKFTNDWQMLYGKKLANSDVVAITNYYPWTTNTVYSMYDSTKDMSDANFFVVTTPTNLGGAYNVFKCIYNNGNTPSTQLPDQVQAGSFTKSDGYVWRYITSISSQQFNKFATDKYIPIIHNDSITSSAYEYQGVEVVVITNGGNGYSCYTNGVVQGVINSTCFQISNNASIQSNYYTNSGVYFYNTGSATAQLARVVGSFNNSSGNFITTNTALNVTYIQPQTTYYNISPAVVFQTDGSSDPQAYSVVNTVSNSINSIVITDIGNGISWANVSIISNTSYGTGATAYAITPPPGGHGYEPVNELNCDGFVVSFYFANSELSTIPTEIQYNKIGLIKNPYTINTTSFGALSRTSANTFSQVLKANVSSSVIYSVGDKVYGNTSTAVGVVAFSNSTTLFLTGDKYFSNGEYISNGTISTQITINTIGDLYTKDTVPLYIQNVTNVQRANNQTESFRLVIQI